MPLSGHCLCKAVTYTVDIDAPLIVGYDHCDDCQRQSGSTYCRCSPWLPPPSPPQFELSKAVPWLLTFPTALVAVVPKDKLTVKGPIKKWSGTGSSGHAVHRLFCSDCGSPIAHDPDAAPEIIALKAGTFDTEIKKNLKPVCSAIPCNSPLTDLNLSSRIPRFGPLASFLFARSTWRSLSRICPSKQAPNGGFTKHAMI